MNKKNGKQTFLSVSEIDSLFANSEPDLVWDQAVEIISRINPSHDFSLAKKAFDDVMRVFRGQYPGFCPIKTPYHNLPHTLDVFLCATRLMYGVNFSGTPLTSDEITLVMIAALMHDIGYAQRIDEDFGTGAQLTCIHVERGISFMKSYMVEQNYPAGFVPQLEAMIAGTDPSQQFAGIHFPSDRVRLLGQMVVSSDLVGQMADRTYLEKLLFLYLEFNEARFGNFKNVQDLLRQTGNFYAKTRSKLDGDLGSMYTRLSFYFKDVFGVDENYYLRSIERNINYLEKVISQHEAECLIMLKRGGIVEKSKSIMPD